jgi:hypothetical protein
VLVILSPSSTSPKSSIFDFKPVSGSQKGRS